MPARRRTLPYVAVATTAALIVAALLLWPAPTHDATLSPSVPRPTPTPTRAAADVGWVDYLGVRLPVSRTDGPLQLAGGRARGFTRTDQGAALAAAHLLLRASPSPGPAVFRPTIEEQVTGEERDALATTVAADYAAVRTQSHLPDGAPIQGGAVEVLGYRVVAASPYVRRLTLVERARDANGVEQTFEVDLAVQWVGGDWNLVAPVDGTWTSAFSQLATGPRPYRPFGGS